MGEGVCPDLSARLGWEMTPTVGEMEVRKTYIRYFLTEIVSVIILSN